MHNAFFVEDTTTIKLDVINDTVIRTRLMKTFGIVPSDGNLTSLVDIFVERLKDKPEHGFYIDVGSRDKIPCLNFKFQFSVSISSFNFKFQVSVSSFSFRFQF